MKWAARQCTKRKVKAEWWVDRTELDIKPNKWWNSRAFDRTPEFRARDVCGMRIFVFFFFFFRIQMWLTKRKNEKKKNFTSLENRVIDRTREHFRWKTKKKFSPPRNQFTNDTKRMVSNSLASMRRFEFNSRDKPKGRRIGASNELNLSCDGLNYRHVFLSF